MTAWLWNLLCYGVLTYQDIVTCPFCRRIPHKGCEAMFSTSVWYGFCTVARLKWSLECLQSFIYLFLWCFDLPLSCFVLMFGVSKGSFIWTEHLGVIALACLSPEGSSCQDRSEAMNVQHKPGIRIHFKANHQTVECVFFLSAGCLIEIKNMVTYRSCRA